MWSSGQETTLQCKGHRIDPWSWKILHAMEQLSPCATTTEPVLDSRRAAPTKAWVPKACALQQEALLQ